MNLTIDIGNTRSKWALFDNGQVVRRGTVAADEPWDLPTGCRTMVCATGRADLQHMGLGEGGAELLSWQTPLPIGLKYATPETLGADRIAAACGAWKLSGNGRPKVIIDAGTCITIDYVDAAGDYCGGAILPGMEMKFRALHTFTAKLPLLENIDGSDAAVCGTTTRESLIAGVVVATRYEAEGFAAHYLRLDPATELFVTGGDAARLLGDGTAGLAGCRWEPDLVMIGMDAILEFGIKNKELKNI